VSVAAEQQVNLQRGADGTYPSKTFAGPFWTPGGAITIHVQGLNGDPPPFSATLTGPEAVTVTQPTDSAIVVDRTQDLAFAWTGETRDYLMVTTHRSTGQTRYISCRWAAPDGTRNVPSSILAGLPAGATSFEVSVVATAATSIIGAWTMSASATVGVSTISATLQ
jgi:hypothetical protein